MPSLVISQDCVNVNIHSRHLEMTRHEDSELFNRTKRIKVPLVDVDRVIVCGRPAVSIPVDIVIALNPVAVGYLIVGVVVGSACANVPARLRPREQM